MNKGYVDQLKVTMINKPESVLYKKFWIFINYALVICKFSFCYNYMVGIISVNHKKVEHTSS